MPALHNGALPAILLMALAAPALAQAPPRSFDIDAIYAPGTSLNASGTLPSAVTWLDDESWVSSGRGNSRWQRVDARSGRLTSLFERDQLADALRAIPGMESGDAEVAAGGGGVLSPAADALLLDIQDDLYVYDIASARAVRLTSAPGLEEEATFSPDGSRVAFVRGHDLYAVAVTGGPEHRLTTDGSAVVLNGQLDWLYQEEIYGRGRFRGYWWSPDSSRLAFLRLDETSVPAYTVIDDLPVHPSVEITPYPKAGDPNPGVRLGVVAATGGPVAWPDLGAYGPEILIVDVDWTPDARSVVFQVQDREQTWLDLLAAPAGATAPPRRLVRETTSAWVDRNGNPLWLRDGSFLWLSERSGFRHVYHLAGDGALLRQVTTGSWEVRTVHGIDESNGLLYFSASADSPVGTDLYRVGLDGRGFTRLSRGDGTHGATFNPSLTLYVGTWSDIRTPTQVRLHRADGEAIRVIDANPVTVLDGFGLSTPEFVQVPARDGFLMEGLIIRPPDFDPARRYPVFQETYAGPGASTVRNQWLGRNYLFYQLLAQRGVIVWLLDNRSASGKGAQSRWPVYGRLGEVELADLEDGLAWLRRQPGVDQQRAVLMGWSYGGFMTAYALTHSRAWSAGIAGAPVTDWRNYDTVYTERYMKTPRNNAEGYASTAPRLSADGLEGRLLVVHGTIDDNVHLQNSLQFANALQRAGKPFEMMLYPRSRHGVTDPTLNLHLRHLMLDFIERTTAAPGAR
ncbi:MAG: S9 family peptidase [Acidobacteria bacterium]|nr:S9 family peptidase [Acidobacteriota bacterium]